MQQLKLCKIYIITRSIQPTDPKRKPLAGPGKKANAASKKGAKTEEVKQNWSRGRKRPAEPYPVDESSDEEIPATPKKKGPQVSDGGYLRFVLGRKYEKMDFFH